MAEEEDGWTDYTSSTPWEAFVSELEATLRSWGLADASNVDSSEVSSCSVAVRHAGTAYRLTLHCAPVGEGEGSLQEWGGVDELSHLSPTSLALLNPGGAVGVDFPTRVAHRIQRWFGVRERVWFAPRAALGRQHTRASSRSPLALRQEPLSH